MQTIKVQITAELIESFLEQGNAIEAAYVTSGLPNDARLVGVDFQEGPPRNVTLEFQSESRDGPACFQPITFETATD